MNVNCAAIPGGLLESELFGHERGAFTGAITQTAGRFQIANRGTLFLDEIGYLPVELQPKLLRALQEQEFEKVGGSQTIRVDVRIVAATNQDLAQMVQDRQFRMDLYYRLNVFPIELPPLRDRRDDVPILAQHFVRLFAERMNRDIVDIPESILDMLRLHDWPGNIRERQNFIERAVLVTRGGSLQPPLVELKRMAPRLANAPIRTLAEVERPISPKLCGTPTGSAETPALPRCWDCLAPRSLPACASTASRERRLCFQRTEGISCLRAQAPRLGVQRRRRASRADSRWCLQVSELSIESFGLED